MTPCIVVVLDDRWSSLTLSLPRNITSHSIKNLAFHSLPKRTMIILPILTTSLMHFFLKGWENVLFELGSKTLKTVLQRFSGTTEGPLLARPQSAFGKSRLAAITVQFQSNCGFSHQVFWRSHRVLVHAIHGRVVARYNGRVAALNVLFTKAFFLEVDESWVQSIEVSINRSAPTGRHFPPDSYGQF